MFIAVSPVFLMWQLGLIIICCDYFFSVSAPVGISLINKVDVAPALLSIIRVYMKVSQIAAVANF